MKSRVLKWIAAGLIAVVLVAGTGLFLFRGALLRCVADEKLAALEQRYNLRIAYRELGMPSLSVIRLEGLTVVPEDHDTLLTLEKAEIDIDLLPLLRKRVSVHQVDVEGMKLSFVKQGNVSNYDFLFRQQTVSEADPGKVESVLAGYDVQVAWYSDYCRKMENCAI